MTAYSSPPQPDLWTAPPPPQPHGYRPRQPGEHWRTTERITLVTPLYLNNKKGDPTGLYSPRDDQAEPIIAVFRGDSRMYHSYEYRSGLRFERLKRMLGRR